MVDQMQQRVEKLGPSERIVQALTTVTDHLVHNRPGAITKAPHTNLGVEWRPATWRLQDGVKTVFRKDKAGKKTVEVKLGVLDADGKTVKDGRTVVGEFRTPGLYPEVAAWMYRQVADVFKVDNEFVARWASWSFPQEHRDLKVILAAFLLVQDRKGDPVVEDGKVLFNDDDLRNVGEAMCLLRSKNDLNPKLLLRVGQVLELPAVAAINRELGFGKSARNPMMGRWPGAVTKWLRNREQNPKVLEGLVKAGFKGTVKDLARKVGYKPSSPQFFVTLGWKQIQAEDGHRQILDVTLKAVDSWAELSERQICEKIMAEKPNYKTIVGKLPATVGVTRAVMAAAIEAGCLSDKDLIILTPTLEELGLLGVPAIAERHAKALAQAEDQRSANIARNVKSQVVKDQLQDAADKVAVKVMIEATKDMRIYCMVDRSGSMTGAIERAKAYLSRLLVGFPLDRLHVSAFESMGKEITIKAPKAAAVEQAFKGIAASGGTSYSNGLLVLMKHKPKDGEDVLLLWIGDEQGEPGLNLAATIRATGLNPVGFGLLHVAGGAYGDNGRTVKDAAAVLGLPCFDIEEGMFTEDPYSVTRILQRLVAATPVGKAQVGRPAPTRVTLVEQILKTDLLKVPIAYQAA
ncbi:MAG: hypothetical protein A2Y38_09520 [Spirochaetes bacterium GWB1_59_5]|nr:MAG: hypothetical protein A2Y38_09520 [Spirochaetes bacterium GWB1_59_5]